MESYEQLVTALSTIGLTGQLMRRNQLVVSTQRGNVWPNQGTSFWISNISGEWYISTWAPICYKVALVDQLLSLCAACVESGNSAISHIPDEIVTRFQLQQIVDAEFIRLFHLNDSPNDH